MKDTHAKTVWISAAGTDFEDVKPRITTGLESGADYILTNAEFVEQVRQLGSIKVAAFTEAIMDADVMVVGHDSEGDGTLPLPSDFSGSKDILLAQKMKEEGAIVAGYVVIHNKQYELFASEFGRVCDYLFMVGTDWQVIPLENLIASLQELDVNIIAGVQDAEGANLALETLEHGSDGILVDTDNLSELKKSVEIVDKAKMEKQNVRAATVTEVKQVGMGDRVCVDTCSLMTRGEGMLIGSQSNGLFLINSESDESPYVAARPFRVNAGAVHAYVKVGEKTRYLSELKSGDVVTAVNSDGDARPVIVGRVKIERRPLMLIVAETDGEVIKTIVQNAETIKLVGKDGVPISVSDLRVGDEVLVQYEKMARHFGMKIEETIIEK